MKASTIAKKPVGGKIADRLKAFESAKEDIPPPPPPPPPTPPKEEKDKKKSSLSKTATSTSKSTSKKEKEIVEETPVPLKKTTSKTKEVPGSFPEDDLIEIVDMPIDKKSSKKSKSATKEKEVPKKAPEEVPEVKSTPESPPTPPPEPKSSKKERPKVVRDGGSSWGTWGAATPKKDEKEKEKEKKSSKDRKASDSPPKDEKKSKDTDLKRSKSSKKPSEKEESSSKGSSSDKADSRPPVSRGLSSMFGAAPPLSRSKSVTERRSSTSGKTSSRRPSIAEGTGLMSPPPEMSSKAARMLGVTPGKLARSKSEKQSKSRGMFSLSPLRADIANGIQDVDDDDDIIMVDAASPDKSSRDRKKKSKVLSDPIFKPPPAVPMPPGDDNLPIRKKRTSTMNSIANARILKQTKQEDDIVMVDAGGPSDAPGLKRTDSIAKKAGLGGMFGGLLSKSRPDNKRRSTALTDDEGARGLRREDRKIKRAAKDRPENDDADRDITMSGGAAEEDQDARREARRARKAQKEADERAVDEARRARDEERREKRRRQEEEAEAKLREEKEARRAARREQRARDEEERLANEAKEAKEAERTERRRARRAERETHTDGEPLTEDPHRIRKSDRRKSYMDKPTDDDQDRKRRREERHIRSSETPKTSRRKSAPIVDGYFDPRNGSKREPEFLPAEGPVYKDSRRKKAGWPHSGTDSWVADHSDAPPPPPDDTPMDMNPVDDTADENARRALRKTRQQSRYGDDVTDDHDDSRRRRRRGETIKSSEADSQNDGGRRSRAPSAAGGLFTRFKQKISGV